VNFKQAEEAVASLGDGWRIPTVEELNSLVDRSRHNPAINTHYFSDTYNDGYWTSERCSWSESARWVVDFYDGSVTYDYGLDWCVRAVRSGQ